MEGTPKLDRNSELSADCVRLLREVVAYTYMTGNGGYVAEIGPLTFGRICEVVGVPEALDMKRMREWASER